jgi:hypothetical protein
MNLSDRRNELDEHLLRRKIAQRTADAERCQLAVVSDSLDGIQEAQTIAQTIAQTLQQRAHDRIASVVTRCLNAVFDDPYEFRIRFDRKRGKTEARLTFLRDGLELDDPLNEVGGGVIDVASLALRLACLLLSRPPLRRLIVLDEPFKNIRGEGNKARTREMILRLAEDLDIQFVINTDIPEYRLGTVVEVG